MLFARERVVRLGGTGGDASVVIDFLFARLEYAATMARAWVALGEGGSWVMGRGVAALAATRFCVAFDGFLLETARVALAERAEAERVAAAGAASWLIE